LSSYYPLPSLQIAIGKLSGLPPGQPAGRQGGRRISASFSPLGETGKGVT